MKRILQLVVVVCLGALLSASVSAATVPFPTLQFDYKNPKVPDDLLVYSAEPTFEFGDNLLHEMSFAAIHAPSAVWANNRYSMEQDGWTVEEFNKQWNEFLKWWRRGYFDISLVLYSDEVYAVMAGPVGVGNYIKAIDRIILINSNGYREEKMMPGVSPRRLANGPTLYKNEFTLTFRKEALDSKPEWIRVYVLSLGTRYYFEWKFDY